MTVGLGESAFITIEGAALVYLTLFLVRSCRFCRFRITKSAGFDDKVLPRAWIVSITFLLVASLATLRAQFNFLKDASGKLMRLFKLSVYFGTLLSSVFGAVSSGFSLASSTYACSFVFIKLRFFLNFLRRQG